MKDTKNNKLENLRQNTIKDISKNGDFVFFFLIYLKNKFIKIYKIVITQIIFFVRLLK